MEIPTTPKTRRTRGKKMDCSLSTEDLLSLSVSPLQLKPEKATNQRSNRVLRSKGRKCNSRGQINESVKTSTPRRGRNGHANESSPAKCWNRNKGCMEREEMQQDPPIQSLQHCRSTFELQEMEITGQGGLSHSESQQSSDLSIELSSPWEELNNISHEEEELEEEEEEEMPSFLSQEVKTPASIKEGAIVWCKFRTYPFWPAVVKSVNRKLRKASIIWIDVPMFDKKKKGLCVALKTLKPFECEEANQLVCTAKIMCEAVIDWSLELIDDYVFRIACRSFTGSFIDYCAHTMSYPVRRKYPQTESERLAIPSELVEPGQIGDHESFSEQPEESGQCSKRLLPDRTHAAHNRANEKLVHFIVSQHMVEQHLLAVISGEQPSRWLRSFLKVKRRLLVENYLEDDEQLDQVYNYLKELFENAADTAPCLANVIFMDRVRFVLDVLLPEAIIHAIAGVDTISLKKAEEKYLNGRGISNREKEEFEWKIDQHIRTKSTL